MPKKRANGQGCIYLDNRTNRYRVSYTASRNRKTGKIIRKSFSADTFEEAEEKLGKVLQQIKDGTYKIEAEMFYKDWITYWLDECKVNTVERTTLENYKSNINNHIIPWLGNVKLKNLSVKEIQQFYNHLYEDGREDGKGGLNPRTVQRIHTIVNSSLKHAVRCEVINKNVATFVVKRKMRKFEIDPYSSEELKEFLTLTKDEKFYSLFVVSAMTGMRRGEVLALTWDDVDLVNRKISVRKSLGQRKVTENERKRVIELKDTKTESSRRDIPIDKFLTDTLIEHKKNQLELSLKIGRESFNPNNLIFCEDNGNFINPSKYTNVFKSTLKKYNLRKIRLHDVRHAYATILLHEGISHKSIKDLLGHSTIVTTLDIYTHSNMSELRKATDKLSSVLMI